jgi:hypothetical protein
MKSFIPQHINPIKEIDDHDILRANKPKVTLKKILKHPLFKAFGSCAYFFLSIGGIAFILLYIYASSAISTFQLAEALNVTNTIAMQEYTEISMKVLTRSADVIFDMAFYSLILFVSGIVLSYLSIKKSKEVS